MNITPPTAAGISFGQDLDRLKQLPEREAIGRLSREFEAIFVREILKNAQKTVIESSITREDGASAIYRDMMVEHLANGIRDAGGLGVAEALERDLTRQVAARSGPETRADAATKDSKPPQGGLTNHVSHD